MPSPVAQLAQVFARDIPLSQAMSIRVCQWSDRQLRLEFPLAPNTNHQASMFGGSLYCAAVLAAWGWLHLALREEGVDTTHIVVQTGEIRYLRPVYADPATVLCAAPDEQLWQDLLDTWHKHGKARLQLVSKVLTEQGEEGAVLTGQFVLHRG